NPGSTYTWVVPAGATIISGQGTNNITLDFGSTGGTVSVTESNSFGSTTSSATVTINTATGILTAYNFHEMNAEVYPNPFMKEVSITFNAPEIVPIILKIVNMKGEVIYESGGFTTNEK